MDSRRPEGGVCVEGPKPDLGSFSGQFGSDSGCDSDFLVCNSDFWPVTLTFGPNLNHCTETSPPNHVTGAPTPCGHFLRKNGTETGLMLKILKFAGVDGAHGPVRAPEKSPGNFIISNTFKILLTY